MKRFKIKSDKDGLKVWRRGLDKVPRISHAGGLKLKSVSSSPGHAIVDAE